MSEIPERLKPVPQHSFKKGDELRILTDGDGAAGATGIVLITFPSGRMRIGFADGTFRMMTAAQVEAK